MGRASAIWNPWTLGLDVSVEFSVSPKTIDFPLQDSIRELRKGYQSVSECLEQSLAECDLRIAELADCRRQLVEANRNVAGQEKRVAEHARAEAAALERCTAVQQKLAAIECERSELELRASHAEAEATQSKQRLEIQNEHHQQLQAQISRLESEGEASRAELAQLRGQFGSLAETAADAARLRGELAAAVAELARLREQVASVPDEELLRGQLAAAQAERGDMESELELLRSRGAELSEALAEQKRVMADERDHWNEELRHLRRAVERQSELLAQGSASVAENGVALPADPPRARPANNNYGDGVVVDSVVEQFALLQKNKVRKLASP
jgi:chromosome segregation ATPase